MPITLPMGQSPEVTDRPIRRRYAVDGRVRSGCLTCKARKKKCDGQSSTLDGRCGSCVRLGLVCDKPPLQRVPTRAPRRRASRYEEVTSRWPPVLDEDGTVNGGTENRESDDPADDDENGHRDSPTHDETGHWDSSAHGQNSALVVSTIPYMPAISGSWDGMERVLLRYFLDRVAPLCSILQQDGSSFCSVLLPMAIVDPSLLHALFAYASVHFDASTPGTLATSGARLKFENQVIRGVAEAIGKNAVTETTVACALLTSTAEVIRGDTSRWLVHLQGAGYLVNHLGTSRLLRLTDGAFLLRYFAYHDIMASLSTGRRKLVNGEYFVESATANVESADSFMGLSFHIFRHFSEICAFVVDTADLGSSSCSDRRSRDTMRGEDMAQALRSQDLHLQVDRTNIHTQALIHHAEAFRFAGLFYLYRHILRFCEAGAVTRLRMEDCVRQILQHVSEVPSDLFCEIGLLFPLFMAGIGSGGDAGMQQNIQSRLMHVETWTKFRHVTRARELLQLLWDKGRTDWETMLRELDWSLSLA